MKNSLQSRKFSVKVVYLTVFLFSLLASHLSGPLPSANITAQGKNQIASEFAPATAAGGGYVISEHNGQRVCREATAAESLRLRQAGDEARLRVIYGGRTAARGAEQAQTGLRITLRATAQLDNFPEAKAAFIRAAQNWEAQILTPISIVVDVDFGTTFFGENYRDANTIGATTPQFIGSRTGYANIRAALIAGASSVGETALYGALPAQQLPTDQGDLTAVFSDASVFRALGLISPNANPDVEQTQLGSPPRIGFNSAFPFDFDPGDGIAANRFDFDGIATHEIGHALGFGSAVGERELNPSATLSVTLLDFFRFRPGVNLDAFPAAQRILASGGAQVFFGGGAELGLSTGRPDGMGGDGNQASHWKADELTGVYLGVMDPTASRGQRDQITRNDLHAFDTIGYRVRSVQQQIDASPRALDFGDTPLNAGVERTLIVANTGGQPLEVAGITISNAQFGLVSPATPFIITPNSQQNVVLRFTPTANGAQSATLTLASNDPNRPSLTVPLSGFGGLQPTVALVSGTAQNGAIPAPPVANDCQIDPTQYTIQALPNATQLRVTLTGNQDVDLYARFGQRVSGVSPDWMADHVSDSPNNSETITITPTGSPALRAGTYYIGVTNCGPGAANYTVTATVTGGAAALAAVSGASFRGAELTSESIVAAFGQNLATTTASGDTNPLPTMLAGSTVRVRDSAGTERLAPLFFVSPGQINFLMPPGTALGTATITATGGNGAMAAGAVDIVAVAPGLFAANADGQGVAAAVAVRVRADGSQSFEPATRFDPATNRFVSVPIDLGPASEQVALVLFGTGFRNLGSQTDVTARIGGTPVQVLYAGTQGSLFGLDQANLSLPRTLIGRGEVDVVLTLGGKTSNTVRVNIR